MKTCVNQPLGRGTIKLIKGVGKYAVEVEKMYQARGGDAMNAAEELAFFLDSFIDLYQNHKDVLRFIRSFETYIRYENVPEEDVRVYNEVVDGFARKFHAVYEKAHPRAHSAYGGQE